MRVRHGVYAEQEGWAALAPWERYAARVHAIALVRPASVFCLESAAALTGMPVFGEPRDIHIYDPEMPASRRFGDVAVHTSRTQRLIHWRDGVGFTTVAETAVDLARVLPPAFGLAVVDAAITTRRTGARQVGAASVEELKELNSARASRRGVRLAAWAFDHADERSESPGESVSRAVLNWLGFAAPELQQVFRLEGFEDRGDFYWPDKRVLGESDGYGKYGADDPAETRRILLREKSREDRLRRHLGGFVRWDWSDAMRAAPLRDKLLAAGIPIERPEERALLATLRSNPRSRGGRGPAPHSALSFRPAEKARRA